MSSKMERLARLRNGNNKINALAIDQRGSLKKMLAKAMGTEARDEDVIAFKNTVVKLLTPYTSGVLLDPEYGLPALEKKDPRCGALLAYEKSGYDVTTKGRLPDLLSDWTVAKLRDAGADAIKLLVYYDPFDAESVNNIKKDFIRDVGKECTAEDMPFFLEIIGYSDAIGDEKGLAFAKEKPRYVKGYMEEFSKEEYGVTVFKVEFPVNMVYVEGSGAFNGGEYAQTKEQAREILRQAAGWTQLPFIYLSAGVDFDVFADSLRMANEAGVKFDGVLCGRATWQEAVGVYRSESDTELLSWLKSTGVQRLQTLNELLS